MSEPAPPDPADEQPTEPVEPDVPPPPPPRAEGDAFDQIVDDVQPRREAQDWAWAQMRHGRDGEDVVQDLINAGWDLDDAEVLVESARKSEGALEAVANAPLPPMSMRGVAIPGLRLVYYLVGFVERIFRGASAVEEERVRRRHPTSAGHCVRCGFDLHGSTGPCPNCGAQQPDKG